MREVVSITCITINRRAEGHFIGRPRNHVHLFVNAHPIFAPANIVKIFKGITAKKLFEKHPELRNQLWNGHLWNPSYYVGTCGDATKDAIERYVAMQKVK